MIPTVPHDNNILWNAVNNLQIFSVSRKFGSTRRRHYAVVYGMFQCLAIADNIHVINEWNDWCTIHSILFYATFFTISSFIQSIECQNIPEKLFIYFNISITNFATRCLQILVPNSRMIGQKRYQIFLSLGQNY